MKLGAVESIKFKRLKRRLKLPQCFVIGVLESIWTFAARNAVLGDIGKLSNEDIASAIEWPDDPDELVNALVDAGWFDRSDRHRLVIHDWHEHMPRWLHGNLTRHGKRAVTDPDYETKQCPQQSAQRPAQQATQQAAQDTTKQRAGDAACSDLISSDCISSDLISSDPPPPDFAGATWGVVAEQMKAFGVMRVQDAIASANATGFIPPQVLALIGWLREQPAGAYSAGVLVERLECRDAVEWDAHQNWPPPAGVTVVSEPSRYVESPGQKQLAERAAAERREAHSKSAAEVRRLEETFGVELDAMAKEELNELIGESAVARSEVERHGHGRDSPARGLLLKRMAKRKARAV